MYKIENITGRSKTVFQVWIPNRKTYWSSRHDYTPYTFLTKKSAIKNIKEYNSYPFNNKIDKNYQIHKIEYIELMKDIEIV
jgi:hypothetical protein